MEKPAERQLDSVEHEDLTHDIDQKLEAGEVVQMRSELDNMQPYRAAFVYWRVSLICIAAAFCGAMDGYRKSFRISRAGGRHANPCRGSDGRLDRFEQGFHPTHVKRRRKAQPHPRLCLGRHAVDR